jgi:hypothetical protein
LKAGVKTMTTQMIAWNTLGSVDEVNSQII